MRSSVASDTDKRGVPSDEERPVLTRGLAIKQVLHLGDRETRATSSTTCTFVASVTTGFATGSSYPLFLTTSSCLVSCVKARRPTRARRILSY
jgi:hypothetical protein